MAANTKLAVFHILAVCEWLLTVGWDQKAPPPLDSFDFALLPLSDT